MRPGLYLVHKPVGATSFQLVQSFMADEAADAKAEGRKPLPMCHGGTLDPFAEGLLLMLVGQTTRLMDLFHAAPKVYEAELAWGLETDNGDLAGVEILRGDASRLTPEALDAALPQFLGWRDQVPPATSAKKIGGEPAYKKAHRGEEVVLPPSKVFLHSARWLSHTLPSSSRVELTCRGGFYVRALARDLGRTLGCGAHVHSLRRSAIGPWNDPPPGERILISGDGLLPWCPSRQLSERDLDDLRHGRPIPKGELSPPGWPLPEGFPDPKAPVRALQDGKLWAMLRDDGETLSTFANLRGGL
ncbi:MAG: tRNA pseudouridine(55) synthase TruB [Myxococcales bacterium]